jgi:hypothetical protein
MELKIDELSLERLALKTSSAKHHFARRVLYGKRVRDF